MRDLTFDELKVCFPKLRPDNHIPRSHSTARYNCVAFVNGDKRHWWQPGQHGGRFRWPADIKQHDTLAAWTELFLKDGYVVTDNQTVESGYEKIAIYVDPETALPSHVAKSDGVTWMSKLGKGQDIEHSSLDILSGASQDEYGTVTVVLKRKRRAVAISAVARIMKTPASPRVHKRRSKGRRP